MHELKDTHVSLCDTMGLNEGSDKGPKTSCLTAILEGRVTSGSEVSIGL